MNPDLWYFNGMGRTEDRAGYDVRFEKGDHEGTDTVFVKNENVDSITRYYTRPELDKLRKANEDPKSQWSIAAITREVTRPEDNGWVRHKSCGWFYVTLDVDGEEQTLIAATGEERKWIEARLQADGCDISPEPEPIAESPKS